MYTNRNKATHGDKQIELEFLKKYDEINKNEKMKELQIDRNFIGEIPLTSQEVAEITLKRELDRNESEYKYREDQRNNYQTIKYTLDMKKSEVYPKEPLLREPTFDEYTCSSWNYRHLTVKSFQKYVSTILIRNRVKNRLSLIKKQKNSKNDKNIENFDDIPLPPSIINQPTFPKFADKESLKFDPISTTTVTTFNDIRPFELKIPEEYKKLGYDVLPMPYLPQILPIKPILEPISGALEEIVLSKYQNTISTNRNIDISFVEFPEQFLDDANKFVLMSKPSQYPYFILPIHYHELSFDYDLRPHRKVRQINRKVSDQIAETPGYYSLIGQDLPLISWSDTRQPYLPFLHNGIMKDNLFNNLDEIPFCLEEDYLSDTESEDEEAWRGMALPDFDRNIVENEEDTEIWTKVDNKAAPKSKDKKEQKKDVKSKPGQKGGEPSNPSTPIVDTNFQRNKSILEVETIKLEYKKNLHWKYHRLLSDVDKTIKDPTNSFKPIMKWGDNLTTYTST